MNVSCFYGKKISKIRISEDAGITEASTNVRYEQIPDQSANSDVDSDSNSEDEVSYFLVRFIRGVHSHLENLSNKFFQMKITYMLLEKS